MPHFSARLTTGPDHVAELAAWCKANGLTEIFLVAGDAPEAAGPYEGAVDWLRDFLGTDSGVTRIGVTSYPDGHAMFDPSVMHEALHAKQALLAEAGVEGFASTQMCFDADQIKRWLAAERKAGLTLIGRARGKRFLALAGEDRIIFDQDPDSVEEEGGKHRRKGAGDD